MLCHSLVTSKTSKTVVYEQLHLVNLLEFFYACWLKGLWLPYMATTGKMGNDNYRHYDSDIATGLGVGALLFLIANSGGLVDACVVGLEHERLSYLSPSGYSSLLLRSACWQPLFAMPTTPSTCQILLTLARR